VGLAGHQQREECFINL